jgi:HicB family
MRARIGKKENVTRLMVRVPESLHRYLAESARQSNRSLNYEVVTRLRASIELDRLLKIDNADEALLAMAKLKHRLIDLRLQDGDE